jgi:hypothetical protein
MLSFYLAFTYASKTYYDIKRILCMSNFLFEVQKHNRLEQKGVLTRFSIDCYGVQPTLEDLKREQFDKFIELKSKRGTREYDEWFLKYPSDEKTKRTESKKKTPSYTKSTRSKSKKSKTLKNKGFFW